MSDQDIKPIFATGTFAAVTFAPTPGVSVSSARSDTGKNVPEAEKADLEVLARQLNVVSQSIGRDLRFQVDIQTGSSVIQVLDSETGEIIRQIPPEDTRTYLSDRGDVALRLYDARA